MKNTILLTLLFCCLIINNSDAQNPWPGEAWGSSENLTSLDADFNTNMSGQFWNPVKRELWVVSNSGIFWKLKEGGPLGFMIDAAGGNAKWYAGGDLEDITQANLNDNSVFIMNEAGYIEEHSTAVHGTVNKIHSWNIIAQAGPNGGSGPEGITFIPDEWLNYNGFVDQNGNPYTSVNGMGGLMFVAHQTGGYIYAFDLKRSDNTYIFVGKYATGYSESSGLAFDRSIGKMYVWHNLGSNYIEVTQLKSYDIGGGIRQFYTQTSFFGPKAGNLEGIAFTPASTNEDWYFATDDSNQDGYAMYWIQSFNPGVFEPFFKASKTTACVAETITITDTTLGLIGSETFMWDFGSDASPATATGQGPHTVSYVTPGSKSIKLKVTGLFTDSLEKNSYITINPNPVVALGNDLILCNGDSALLDAGNAGSAFLWSTGSTSQTIYVNSAGDYNVSVTSSGCTSRDTVSLGLYSLPVVSITPSAASVCAGSSVTLTAGGASSFVWSSGETTSSIVLIPDTTTSYTVSGTDSHNCVNSASQTITVNDLPVVTISGTTTMCYGQSVTLTASGANSYNWSSGGTSADETVSPTYDSTFTVTATDINYCVNTASQTVTVNDLPVINISGTTTMCYGQSVTLTASGANSYNWSSGGTSADETVSPTYDSTFTVTATDNNYCINTASQTVTVNDLPVINISGTTTMCYGKSVTLTASGANSYNWSSGGTSADETVSPTYDSTFTVTATDNNYCINTASQTITVNDLPVLNISGTTTICYGQSATLTASGANTYNWSSGGTNADETVSPTSDSTYTVTATDNNYCINTASQTVSVLQPVYSIQDLTICHGDSIIAGSNTYTISGTYIDTITGSNSCDSIITTQLFVEDALEISTNVNGAVISANAIANYQWLDCDNSYAVISNETNQAFTAVADGNYAVAITLNGCTDTSLCVFVSIVGTEINTSENNFQIYPNPADGAFNIRFDNNIKNIEIEISDMPGNEIRRINFSGKLLTIEKGELQSGIYFLKITDQTKNVITRKIIIQ